MCKIGENEWISLFTIDAENVWKDSPTDLRMVLTLHHVLQKELKKFELNISEAVDKIKTRHNLSEPEDDDTIIHFDTLLQEKDCTLEPVITRSPKIQRHRKRNYKNSNSPSLLNVPKEKSECALLYSMPIQQNLDVKQKEVNEIRPVDAAEVVDSSIVIDDTPEEDGVFKKSRFIKRSELKKNKPKNSSLTLTQLFTNITSQANNVSKPVVTNEKKEAENLPKRNLFKDFDRIVLPKHTSPDYPHITEPVRKKAERNQLPGWACKECENYYEGLNLPFDKLKEKMNLCSKHRNKYQPLNETPKGFWDVTIFSSQDD